jgi:tRNA(fMet)-specific endonuclease VapC
MRYLLDANLCIAVMNGMATPQARSAVVHGSAGGDELFVPTAVVHELWYGVAKSQRVAANTQTLRKFLSGPLTILDFDAEDAHISGEIRAQLAQKGTPIGPYDVLIAGQALARGLTLVTANTREFSRVAGLKLVDWTR